MSDQQSAIYTEEKITYNVYFLLYIIFNQKQYLLAAMQLLRRYNLYQSSGTAHQTGLTLGIQRVAVLAALAFAEILMPGTMAGAQTRTAHETATAYGARLNANGEPADINSNRINSRVDNRLQTRLRLRIERYRPESVPDPAAALAVRPTDNVRVGTETTLSPLSSSQGDAVSPRQADGSTRPR